MPPESGLGVFLRCLQTPFSFRTKLRQFDLVGRRWLPAGGHKVALVAVLDPLIDTTLAWDGQGVGFYNFQGT